MKSVSSYAVTIPRMLFTISWKRARTWLFVWLFIDSMKMCISVGNIATKAIQLKEGLDNVLHWKPDSWLSIVLWSVPYCQANMHIYIRYYIVWISMLVENGDFVRKKHLLLTNVMF